MELLTKLGINWQQLIAQIVNFAILVGILGYFVYKPLLNVIDARNERIRKAMEEAKRLEQQAKEMEALRLSELKKIDQEAGAFLERAKEQAEQMKAEMIAQAQKEAEGILRRAKTQIDEDRTKLFVDVQSHLGRMIVRMTEKIIEREFKQADQERLLAAIAKDLPTLLHESERA